MKEIESVFKACADRNRIRILKLLEKRKLCVCEIAFVLGITQPSVSRHLKKLKEAGLVDMQQDSFWTNYSIDPKNEYAKKVSALLKKWLNDDAVIERDMKKIRKADRERLCCPAGSKI